MYSENHVIVCEKKPHIFLLHIYKSEFSCHVVLNLLRDCKYRINKT